MQLLTPNAGLDLQGNTFWEFRDTLSSHQHRMRRIVDYPPATHYSEVKISPQWHQWLRHTREDAPSLTEQSQDLVRQRNLKVLAAQADARWAAKESWLDGPETRQALPAVEVRDPGGYETVQERTEAAGGDMREGAGEASAESKIKEERGKSDLPEKKPEAEEKKDPWKTARGGPSEEWQPQGWTGNVASRR